MGVGPGTKIEAEILRVGRENPEALLDEPGAVGGPELRITLYARSGSPMIDHYETEIMPLNRREGILTGMGKLGIKEIHAAKRILAVCKWNAHKSGSEN